jgi:hypothetical protein
MADKSLRLSQDEVEVLEDLIAKHDQYLENAPTADEITLDIDDKIVDILKKAININKT